MARHAGGTALEPPPARASSVVGDWLPLGLLLAYGVSFAAVALGRGLPVFDDHPGQLHRLEHAARFGPAPWRWNPGWWAGYAELQFYPPGAFYLGALLHWSTLGALSLERTYQVLVWLIYLLPGVTTFLLLRRVLPHGAGGWLALPGAFLALTLSAGSRSGVEEGVRWGLIAARLGLGLLPLLGLGLCAWVEGRARPGPWVSVLLGAIVIVHPAHAPAALAMLALAAAYAPGSRRRRFGEASILAGLGLGLAAFWLLPLLFRLSLALPLAWGTSSPVALASRLLERPILLLLIAANAVAWWRLPHIRPLAPATPWLLALAPACLGLAFLDAFVAMPFGASWLPADRLLDSALLALILGAAPVLLLLPRAMARPAGWALGAVLLVAVAGLPVQSGEPGLSLVARRGQWPVYEDVARGVRLDALWAAIAAAPPGRILFLRSAVPLEYGEAEWWRPHSHVTALAPTRTGREIIHGTFTHPSPVAGLVYRGPATHGPIRQLAEELDGIRLFGRSVEALTPEEWNRFAERLRISLVVTLDEDGERLPFLRENRDIGQAARVGPFRVWPSRTPRVLPDPVRPHRLEIAATSAAPGWLAAGIAYSPLWTASSAGRPLATRADGWGLLEVEAPPTILATVTLEYGPRLPEWLGVGLSAVAAVGLALMGWRRRRSGHLPA